jgi:hypothetical protein
MAKQQVPRATQEGNTFSPLRGRSGERHSQVSPSCTLCSTYPIEYSWLKLQSHSK